MTKTGSPTTHSVRHTTVVSAPAKLLYELIADAVNWPVVLGPTIHVERLEANGSRELLRLWATANDTVRTWTSARVLDAEAMRISFRQVSSPPPLAAMGGEWSLEALSPMETRVVLDHDFSVMNDDSEATAWVMTAVDRNSTAELDAMKQVAEHSSERTELTVSFADSLLISSSVDQVYEYLNKAGEWPQRLPHVSSLELTEPEEGLQVMRMDTTTADGSVHSSRSVRVCFPNSRIVYKQIEAPALMSVHTGEWTLDADANGVLATSKHTVVIKPEAVPIVLGPDTSVADAKQFVRKALGHNSMTTLQCAKLFTESETTSMA